MARVIVKAESKKTKFIGFLDTASYWILLAVAIVGNILVSFTLIPFIILLSNINLFIIIIILGASFGIMFSSVIRDVEIQLHHHTLILFVVPLVAFISFFIITNMSNAIATTYDIHTTHNPAFVGILYVFAFLVPYINLLFTKYIKEHKKSIKV
ncbi:MAG: hypothetical protein ACTSUV_06880 [Candidatus Ranarchaeia archaeon]